MYNTLNELTRLGTFVYYLKAKRTNSAAILLAFLMIRILSSSAIVIILNIGNDNPCVTIATREIYSLLINTITTILY
jgi:hypothetical protein